MVIGICLINSIILIFVMILNIIGYYINKFYKYHNITLVEYNIYPHFLIN